MKSLILAILICGALSATLPAGKSYSRKWGWAEGKVVSFYTFVNGNFSSNGVVQTAPIYVFTLDGNVPTTQVQPNIINVVPGDTGYSDLWQVYLVTVTTAPNPVITSYADLMTAKTTGTVVTAITATTTTKNCPVVGSGSTLDPADTSKYPLIQGYYMGSSVSYFDFGVNPATTQPVYHLVNGTNGTEVLGAIFETVPADSSYTAFWQLQNVPVSMSYVNGTYTTTGQVEAFGTDQSTLVNCPIVYTASSVTGNTTAVYQAPTSAN